MADFVRVGKGKAVGDEIADTFNLSALNGTGQIHAYGNQGDDYLELNFYNITGFSHGQHVYGEAGADIFNLTNTDRVQDFISGRIDDFDYSRDTLQIEGVTVDLKDLDSFRHENVIHIGLYEFNGDHNDPGAHAQQYLLVKTISGGRIFYAMDGARIDMDGDGSANRGYQERHFLHPDIDGEPDYSILRQVFYSDPINVVPEGYAPPDGLVINDQDKDPGNGEWRNWISNVFADRVYEPVMGGEAGDLIAGGLNDDHIFGGGGDDVIWGGSGHDSLFGGSGNDTLNGTIGGDLLDGGTGIDTASYHGSGYGVSVSLRHGAADGGTASGDVLLHIENLLGSDHDDTLTGSNGTNTLDGGDGDDVIRARLGNDTVLGEEGEDILFGGRDNDLMMGGAGADKIWGGHGHDTLFGGDGIDVIGAGSWHDVVYGGGGADQLRGGRGNDTLFGEFGDDVVIGGRGQDTLFGGDGDDVLTGGRGHDVFVFTKGGDTDRITDFQNNEDMLLLEGLGITSSADALSFASQSGSDVVFDFGDGDIIVVENSGLTALQDDLDWG